VTDDAVPLASVVRAWATASLFVARSIGRRFALEQQSPRPTNGRRFEDLTGLVPQSDGLFAALSLKGRLQ